MATKWYLSRDREGQRCYVLSEKPPRQIKGLWHTDSEEILRLTSEEYVDGQRANPLLEPGDGPIRVEVEFRCKRV